MTFALGIIAGIALTIAVGFGLVVWAASTSEVGP